MTQEKLETNYAKLKRLKKIKEPNFAERNLIKMLEKAESKKLKKNEIL